MKFIRVFAPSYYGLRAQHLNAFAIRPTRGGYEGVIEVKKVSSQVLTFCRIGVYLTHTNQEQETPK